MNKKYLPTDYEGRKGRLIEEIGEVLAALGKIDRFGLYSSNPLLPAEEREENWEWLSRELDDLVHAVSEIKLDLHPQVRAPVHTTKIDWGSDDWDPQP